MAVLYEFCAGLASLSLSYLGLKPPVSRIGNKTGYVEEIKKALGLFELPERIVLTDTDIAVVAALRGMLFHGAEVADLIKRTYRPLPSEIAWRQAKCRLTRTSAQELAAAWFVATAGSRGGIGGFKGKHKHRPNVDGFIPNLDSLCERLRAIETVVKASDVAFSVVQRNAMTVELAPFAQSDCFIYIDPPYAGAQPYADDQPLSVAGLARMWKSTSPVKAIVISEREPLAGRIGRHWQSIEITKKRKGQHRRSLTTSQAEWLTYWRAP